MTKESEAPAAGSALPERDPVPLSVWSKDHWSTFAYIATLIVGRDGQPDKDKMRTDPDRHPGLVGRSLALLHSVERKKYPTRLRKDRLLYDHDDWDCVDDAVAAGLILWNGTGVYPVFALTDRGWIVLRELTAFKTAGGSVDAFMPSADEMASAASARSAIEAISRVGGASLKGK